MRVAEKGKEKFVSGSLAPTLSTKEMLVNKEGPNSVDLGQLVDVVIVGPLDNMQPTKELSLARKWHRKKGTTQRKGGNHSEPSTGKRRATIVQDEHHCAKRRCPQHPTTNEEYPTVDDEVLSKVGHQPHRLQ